MLLHLQALQPDTSLRRKLTTFRGDPDPFKGELPNQRVREMAKEALDAMFAATDIGHGKAPDLGLTVRLMAAPVMLVSSQREAAACRKSQRLQAGRSRQRAGDQQA